MQEKQAALLALQDVIQHGASLSAALPQRLQQLSARDAALTQAICYQVLREYEWLEAWLDSLLIKQLPKNTLLLRLILLSGLCQLRFLRIPDHAVVSVSVELTRTSKFAWACGLVNAVLRKASRQTTVDFPQSPSARLALPEWLLKRLSQDWGEAQVEQIAATSRIQAPMILRVNHAHATTDQYLQLLQEAEIPAEKHPLVASAIVLQRAVDVSQLPQFAEGWVSVQDAAAQLAAELLQPPPQAQVLDACSAPGSKACHLLERDPSLQLTAVDIDSERVALIEQNLTRLQLSARCLCTDLIAPIDWAQPESFQRILLDVPCSATGVIRRHPDIKRLRRASDIATLVKLQQQILMNIWPLLAPGGKLLYVSCSILQQENERQMGEFIRITPDAIHTPIEAAWGIERKFGRQIFPSTEMDGFFYALLEKSIR